MEIEFVTYDTLAEVHIDHDAISDQSPFHFGSFIFVNIFKMFKETRITLKYLGTPHKWLHSK